MQAGQKGQCEEDFKDRLKQKKFGWLGSFKGKKPRS